MPWSENLDTVVLDWIRNNEYMQKSKCMKYVQKEGEMEEMERKTKIYAWKNTKGNDLGSQEKAKEK